MSFKTIRTEQQYHAYLRIYGHAGIVIQHSPANLSYANLLIYNS